MLALWITFGIVWVLFILCVAACIVSSKKKAKKEKPLVLDTSDVECPRSLIDEATSLKNQISDIMKMINEKMNAITNQLTQITNVMVQQVQIGAQLENNFKTKYENETQDDDIKTLLAIYNTKPFDHEQWLIVLKKCAEKGIPEAQKIYDHHIQEEEKNQPLHEKSQALQAEFNEWQDVSDLKEREVWTNSECEKTYQKFAKLKSRLSEVEADERYALWYQENIQSKLDREKGYRTLSAYDPLHPYDLYTIGRKEDTVAVWYPNKYEKLISIDDVMYFIVTTKEITIQGKKPSKLGTAVNEMIWGTAAATASAMNKAQNNTTTKTQRKATIYFKNETKIQPLEVRDHMVDSLISLMPEKMK